jgi:phosphatidate cytidylyltransferase
MIKNMSNLGQRLTVSAITIAILLIAIYLSHAPYFRPLFALLGSVLIGVAVWEFYYIGKAKGYAPLDTLGIIASVTYVLATFISTQVPHTEILQGMVLLISLGLAFLYYFRKGADPFINIAITFFALLYLAIPLSTLLNINYYFPTIDGQDGRWWLIYLLSVTKMTDTGGYFFGKRFGTSKFVPYISPRKTYEGAFGGLFLGVATSVILPLITGLSFAVNPLSLTLLQSIVLGLLISLVGQFGDLSESLLKRDGSMKDSNKLPGLGGTLDILDSLVFTAPLVYLFLRINFTGAHV